MKLLQGWMIIVDAITPTSATKTKSSSKDKQPTKLILKHSQSSKNPHISHLKLSKPLMILPFLKQAIRINFRSLLHLTPLPTSISRHPWSNPTTKVKRLIHPSMHKLNIKNHLSLNP